MAILPEMFPGTRANPAASRLCRHDIFFFLFFFFFVSFALVAVCSLPNSGSYSLPSRHLANSALAAVLRIAGPEA